MVAYTKPQQRKKEKSEQLRGERDKIKFIDLRFERWQVLRIMFRHWSNKGRDFFQHWWNSFGIAVRSQ